MGGKVSHDYKVEEWDDGHSRPVEILATAGNFYVAKAAYGEAVTQYPNRPIYLRQGARVLARSQPEPR